MAETQDFRDMSDNRLAQGVRDGIPEAFVELSTRYMGLVRAKAAGFSGPGVPEKEDLFQEGFLGLYAAALSFDESQGTAFSTYAGACVYNRMASAARTHRSSGNRTLNESLPLDYAGDLPAGEEPASRVELQESFAGIWNRIEEALSPLELRVLRLYLGGWRRDEIEARAGMPLKSFDNALHRVRAKLRSLSGRP